MTKVRVVLDTNIYLSGIIFGGNSRHILDLAIKKRITIITSPVILLEISQKLKDKFDWDKEQILIVVKTISKTALIVSPKQRLHVVKTDRNDNKIIEAAVESGARFIVSGDKHLLDIKTYHDIKMMSPSAFLANYFKR